jgi:hypothetical protein
MHFFSKTRFVVPNTSSQHPSTFRREEGIALLLAIIALSVFSLLALHVSLNATTEIRITDNFETRQQADAAARAGLNHARELIRGLQFNDVLRGPDGVGTSTYPSTASGRYAFRSWLSWSAARSLDILDPASSVSGLPDDGLFNTGKSGATNGTILVPATGVALTAPNPYGSGTVTTARYFLKVTDNDDGDGDPFTDSDGIVIVRSTAVAQTIRETAGATVRSNSVAVYESQLMQMRAFNLSVPFVIEGDDVLPADSSMFNGNTFNIDGGLNPYGIGTIDTNTSNTIYPADQIKAALDPKNQYDQIKGQCCTPALGDITASLSADQLALRDPNYLWNVAYTWMPKVADNVYQGNQAWTGTSQPDLGAYDPLKSASDLSQTPKITYVNGDLALSGGVEGGGILVVTGELKITGNLKWTGLIMLIGKGALNMHGGSASVDAGMFIASVQAGSPHTFGTPKMTVAGNGDFKIRPASVNMAVRAFPLTELSRRQVTSMADPQ